MFGRADRIRHVMPETRADLSGFAALLTLGLLAAGGAASAPGGLLLGVPSLTAAAAIAALLSWLWWRGHRAGAPWTALLLVPSGLLFAARYWPPALSGPPLWALFMAGVVSLLASRRAVPSPRVFFVVVLAVYLAAAARVQSVVGPEGDEPHYLMVADSLWRDHDVDLTRDFAEGRYRAFHPEALEPHFRIRGREGEIYSIHAVGLSLLVLPAYVLGGYAGASFFMALLAALLALQIRRTVLAYSGRAALASGVGWIVALSPPLLHYAGLLFTEVPAALIVAVGLRKARDAAALTPGQALLWGASLAFLPWLNVRYALFPVLLLGYALAKGLRSRQSLAAVAPLLASAAAIGLYHFVLYGFFDPRRVYGRTREFALGTLLEGLPGLFLDQEFGIFIYSPAFAIALLGLGRLWKVSRRDAVLLGGLVLVVVLTAGAWDMWRGGFNPPARFLVPVLPVLALGLAFGLSARLPAPTALLIGWGLWTGLAGAVNPALVHRDRDGTAPFFRAQAGAEEWTRLLPGFVLADPDRFRLAAVWVVVLGLAATAKRTPTPGRVALAVSVLLAGIATASTLSKARTEGRDAVRVLGREALQVPAFVRTGSASGRWGPPVLGWGPLYEPHRFPDGATVGARLRLPPGSYDLHVDRDPRIPAGDLPELSLRVEGPQGQTRLSAFEPEGPNRWAARFHVDPGEDGGLRLAIRGGGAFALAGIELRTSTKSPASGPNPR